MGLFFPAEIKDFSCTNRRFPIAFSWLFGLISGTVLGGLNSSFLSEYLLAGSKESTSLFGFLTASVVPMVLSAIAVHSLGSWTLFLSVFFTGFLQSFWGIAVLAGFPCSGWLILVLLFFSSVFSGPLLWLLWLELASVNPKPHKNKIPHIFTGCLLLGVLDHSVITPFLQRIILH